MYIDFDVYSPYSVTIYAFFETYINAHIQCDLGDPYS